MKKRFVIIFLLTALTLVAMTLSINHFAACYPRFTVEFKTPGDGCDLSYFLLRIGYLPHALIVLIGVFIALRVIKHDKSQ